jgi:hypothetical protein
MPDDEVRSSALSKLAQVVEQIPKGNVTEPYAAILTRKNSHSESDIEILLSPASIAVGGVIARVVERRKIAA